MKEDYGGTWSAQETRTRLFQEPSFLCPTLDWGIRRDTHPELKDASIILGETLIQGDDLAQDVLVQSQSLQSSQEPAVT